MMKGLPFSGKTEFARQWIYNSHDRVRVSWTDILYHITARPTKATRLLAFEAAVHLMVQALKAGMSVVIDEENLNGPEWGIFVTKGTQLGAHVEWHAMPIDVEQSKRRSAASDHPVIPTDIERKANDYGVWLKQK